MLCVWGGCVLCVCVFMYCVCAYSCIVCVCYHIMINIFANHTTQTQLHHACTHTPSQNTNTHRIHVPGINRNSAVLHPCSSNTSSSLGTPPCTWYPVNAKCLTMLHRLGSPSNTGCCIRPFDRWCVSFMCTKWRARAPGGVRGAAEVWETRVTRVREVKSEGSHTSWGAKRR